jgi:hypothetical protein
MKTITLKPFALCFAIAGLGQIASAQSDLKLPDVSQAAEVKQRIALTDITVNYHRPLVNGRKIWGGLVPYGKVWRAGANENTTIEFSDAVSVEGKPLDKGLYGLHMIPNPDSCTVIFSKTNTGWGSYSYDQKDDALRVDVKPRPLAETKEALEFEFEDLKPTSTAVTLKWEKLGVPFTVSVNDADQTLQNIRAQLKGAGQFAWQALDQGAQFCLARKINLDEGLRWANASIQNEERFDNLSTKADILKALNRPDEEKPPGIKRSKLPPRCNYIRMVDSCRIRSRALKRWRSLGRWRNAFRKESSDISLRPVSNLQLVISTAR